MFNKIKELISNLKNPKLKNAHCVYFEGQTGLCQAKEFKKCNPINCELYTIDELSTILDLQKKLQAKEQECENLKALQRKTVQLTKEEYDRLIAKSLECEELQKTLSKTEVAKVLIQSAEINYPIIEKYNKALQEIKKVAKQGLNPVCYKINCSRCKCYLGGDFSNAGVTNFINQFFDDNGDLVDEGNFVEELENLIETERKACNRAKPISEKILEIIESIDAESEQ